MRPVLAWLRKAWPEPKQAEAVVRGYHKRFQDTDAVDLEDLRTFCFVYDTTHEPGDPATSARNEGRREVYLHIIGMLQVTAADLKPTRKANADERDPFQPSPGRTR